MRKAGFEYFVDMHVEVDPQLTVQEGHDIAHQVKNGCAKRCRTIRDALVQSTIQKLRCGVCSAGENGMHDGLGKIVA